jgi:ATP-dependent exoDNAse (exonuclease V) beta subunit
VPALQIYKASAGSGKTFTLVKEYLKLALQSPTAYRRVLAVTFTNKAANEMKQRIVDALAELAAEGPIMGKTALSLLPDLIEETKLSEGEIRRNAAKVLTSILHNYSDFAISTIDAFVFRLIRTFARDLRLPFRFEVELSERNITNLAVDKLLGMIGHDEFVTQSLLEFARDKIENNENWNIETGLKHFASGLLKEEAYYQLVKNSEASEEDFLACKSEILSYTYGFENLVSGYAKEALNLISSHGLSSEAFAGKSTGIFSVLQKISKKDFVKAVDSKSWSLWLNDKVWVHKSASPADKVSLSQIEEQLTSLTEKINDSLENQFFKYTLFKLLAGRIHEFALSSAFESQFKRIMDENDLVHISEFNKRIASVVLDSSVPYIYERIGERYQNYLIDEFQDTSVLQWQNFLPLISNSLANNNLVLIVGDGKQAIYRFRGGEVEQFGTLPEIFNKPDLAEFDQIEEQLVRNHQSIVLKQNWRSSAEIVLFNNAFFDFIKPLLGQYQDIYLAQDQQSVNTKDAGYIEFRFSQKKSAIDLTEEYLRWTEEIVLRQREHNFSWRDIAILVRKNKHGNSIADYLSEKGIPVVSSDSLLLTSSVKVRLLIALMRFITDIQNQVILTEIIYDLIQLQIIPDDKTFTEILTDRFIQPANYIQELERLMLCEPGCLTPERLLAMNLYDLTEYLLRILHFQDETDAYVSFLLEEVFAFESRQNSGLSDFLNYWDENCYQISLKVPELLDAVKIMTIHKAKGLEFPVVIYPFADNEIFKLTRKEAWVDLSEEKLGRIKSGLIPISKALINTRFGSLFQEEFEKTNLDAANMLYVCLTRAIRRMYIFTKDTDISKGLEFKFPVLFKKFLMENMGYSAEIPVFSIGDEQNSVRKNVESQNQKQESDFTFVSSDWNNRLEIASDKTSPFDINESQNNAAWGNLVHAILAEIKHFTDLDEVIQRFITEGILNRTEAEKINLQLIDFFDSELLRECYSPGAVIRNEMEIMSASGEIYRPDRYTHLNSRSVLIDYKTGLPSESHIKQMLQYADLIRRMENKSPEAYLVYLQHPLQIVQC